MSLWLRFKAYVKSLLHMFDALGCLLFINPYKTERLSLFEQSHFVHDGHFVQSLPASGDILPWIRAISVPGGWEPVVDDYVVTSNAPPQPSWVKPGLGGAVASEITLDSMVQAGWCNPNGSPWLSTLHGVTSSQALYELLTLRLPIGPVHLRMARTLYPEMTEQRKLMVSRAWNSPPLDINVKGNGFEADSERIYVEDLSALTHLANTLHAQLIAHAYGDALIPRPFLESKHTVRGQIHHMSCCTGIKPSFDRSNTNISPKFFSEMFLQQADFSYGIPSVGCPPARTFMYELCSNRYFIYGLATNSQTGVYLGLMTRYHTSHDEKLPIGVFVGIHRAPPTEQHFVSWVGVLDRRLAGAYEGYRFVEDIIFAPRGTSVPLLQKIREPYVDYSKPIVCINGIHRYDGGSSCKFCIYNKTTIGDRSLKSSYIYLAAPTSTAANVAGLMSRSFSHTPSGQGISTIIVNWLLGDNIPDSSLSRYPIPGEKQFLENYKNDSRRIWKNGYMWPHHTVWYDRSPRVSYMSGPPHLWIGARKSPWVFNLGMNAYPPLVQPLGKVLSSDGLSRDEAINYGIISHDGSWLKIPHSYTTYESMFYDLWFCADYGPMGSYLIDPEYYWVGEFHKKYITPILIRGAHPIQAIQGPGWSVNAEEFMLADYSCLYLAILGVWWEIGKSNNPHLTDSLLGPSFSSDLVGDMSCCTGVKTGVEVANNGLTDNNIRDMTAYFSPNYHGLRAPELLVLRSVAFCNSQDDNFITGWAANIYTPLFPFLSTRDHGELDVVLPMETWVVPPTTTRWPHHLTTWLGAGDHHLRQGIGPHSNIVNVIYSKRGASVKALMRGGPRQPGVKTMQSWSNTCSVGHVMMNNQCDTCQLISDPNCGIVLGSSDMNVLPWVPYSAIKCSIISFGASGTFSDEDEREARQWLHLHTSVLPKPLTRVEETKTSMPFYDIYRGIKAILTWNTKFGIWDHI